METAFPHRLLEGAKVYRTQIPNRFTTKRHAGLLLPAMRFSCFLLGSLICVWFLVNPGHLAASQWSKWAAPQAHTLTAECAIVPSRIDQGAATSLRASMKATDSKRHPLGYVWSGSGGKITGVGQEVSVDASGLKPGVYNVEAVTRDPYGSMATCSAQFEVLGSPDRVATADTTASAAADSVAAPSSVVQPETIPMPEPVPVPDAVPAPEIAAVPEPDIAPEAVAPEASDQPADTFPVADSVSMSCQVASAVVEPGKFVGIVADAEDSFGHPLRYQWFTNGGRVQGEGSQVQLDTSGLTPGVYTITGRAEDSSGTASDCAVDVKVAILPPVVPLEPVNVAQIIFARNRDTLDSGAKAQLQTILERLKEEPAARVSLESYAAPDEKTPMVLADARAETVKRYLVENGVEEARVRTLVGVGGRRGGARNRILDIIWIPEGLDY